LSPEKSHGSVHINALQEKHAVKNIGKKAIFSVNSCFPANSAKSPSFRNSTSSMLPKHKNPEHAIYSSASEYFNATDKFIHPLLTKKPLDFEKCKDFPQIIVSPRSANSTSSAN